MDTPVQVFSCKESSFVPLVLSVRYATDKLDGLMKEFDPLVFQATVNYIKVNSDCTVIFVFRDGTELSWTIQNGVRKYAKRKKGDCDVSAQTANQEE